MSNDDLTRAALHAAARPLSADTEALLRALVDGREDRDEDKAGVLMVWRYAVRIGATLSITDAGRAYLAARDGAQ
ncbi:hypothetical protein [Streptomyces mobaraensis]|uniref:Uncharacterized protein n=1 Tax=Streptomyces mobaraensis TaxID=35621 RepID=A0A5N5WEQ3_STRMB|nr:hypothetical protein [Streptomyces mobaraensis]KAB7850187.1 hypothetical protein FRZ00_06205 [Streptomyces mobaraensis]